MLSAQEERRFRSLKGLGVGRHSKHASFCLICYGGVQIVTLLSARRQGSGVKSVGNGVVCGFTLPRSDKLKDRKDDGLLTRHVLSEFAMVL